MMETTETNFDEFKGKDCVFVFKTDLYLSLIIYNLLYQIVFKVMVNMYGLLTKCEVKMAGYWPSSFFACLNSQKENEANIQPS